jgi:CubicO group peptidase (beta-lactamase class C family)
MLKKHLKYIIAIAVILLLAIGLFVFSLNGASASITKLDEAVAGTWQAEVTFPDWGGYVDDTLAMNSMYSFKGAKNQGKLYLSVKEEVESFDMFVNNHKVNTHSIKNGMYEVDIARLSVDGTNTIQVSNISPSNLEEAITVSIPYPTIINGTLEEVGLSRESFNLISDIISADIQNGFTSAQLAVIKDNKLVYQNSWGLLNSYNQDGSSIEAGEKVTNDTMYDLASNTKMYAVAYGIQYLIDAGKISLEDKIVDILGHDFSDKTIEIKFASYKNYPGLSKIKQMKSSITVKNVLMHQAGFPDSGHYHNEYFDTINQKLDDKVKNVLYVSNANKEKTLKEGIFKTPLIYEPGTRTLYSDIDYMLLGSVIEKVTGQDLNTFLSMTFWQPMHLDRITYNPLQNGFNQNDCAATELNGNTRDGLIDFPRIRKDTVQCEVHDEEAFCMMDGMSGHAGLFANATDLAKLASVMITGGYGNYKFFSENTRDLFIAPQSSATINYGIGWWREADNRRAWYFGTQSSGNTVGHQGWTGTLTMIDFENNMVVVYLTNTINTPIINPTSLENANDFAGRYYTASTLGFVPQIIYAGMDNLANPKQAFKSLIKDMVVEKQKLIDAMAEKTGEKVTNHPILKVKSSLEKVSNKWK